MRSPKWVTALNLDAWAKTPQAKQMLPELIRRLVRATIPSDHLKKFNFPSEAEIHRPGYDGTTLVTTGTPFVPGGVGLWELGCEVGNVKGKAETDYQTRIKEHEENVKAGSAEDIQQATFIAVTPLDWHRPEKWAAEKAAEGKFKDVRAYDSNQLEHWLWEAPAVGLWLAQEILGPRKGVWDLASYWQALQSMLRYPIPPEVLLANRDGMKSTFEKWLKGPPTELAVKAPSVGELVDVFCAWVHSLPPGEAELIGSRAIIVEDRETWRSLATSLNPLILIAAPGLEADSGLYALAAQKHHVLRFAPFTAPRSSGAVEMERMRRYDVQEALKKAGVEDADAAKLADACGGNFTILRRRLARSPADKNPEWESEHLLAPLLLAGSWRDTNANDQKFVITVSGRSNYGDIQTVLTKWWQRPDPPVRLVDGVWEFLSPMDAWEFLHPRLTSDTFEKAAVEILSEDDPALDLAPEDRAMAAFERKVRNFSGRLRKGIAEILALGASREEESCIGTTLHFADRAAAIVRKLLPDGCDWKRWASLGDVLPQLIEAAPTVVMEAVDRDARTSKPALAELMRQEIPPGGAVIFGVAYHTGVLWALEKAGWSAELLPSVALSLAKLAELDPGGKWGNRPANSLQSLFFWWRPQTMASLRQRIDCLQLLMQDRPAIAWKLLLNLLPGVTEAISDNIKPSYRDWAAGWTGVLTSGEYRAFVSELITLLLQNAANAPDRWLEILDHINGFVPEFPKEIAAIRDRLEAVASEGLSPEARIQLWEKLRNLVRDHTSFRDAHWALPEAELAKFTQLRDRLQPEDSVATAKPLFDDEGIRDGDQKLTYEERQKLRFAERCVAIRRLWNEGGFEFLSRLSQQSPHSWEIGLAVAAELRDEPEEIFLPRLLTSENKALRQMAGGYARRRIWDEGAVWAEQVPTPEWTENQIVTFALEMPFAPRAWDWIAKRSRSAEVAYWEETAAIAAWQLPTDDALRAVRELQNAGRAWSAIDVLAMLLHNKIEIDSSILCDSLDALLSKPVEKKGGAMDVHNVTQILAVLQKRTDVDVSRVARLEFSFLGILDRHSLLPHTLQRELSRNPEFFVECLTLLYRPHNEPKTEGAAKEPGAGEAEKARRIWRLLHDWRTIPGSDHEGKVIPSKLKEWVSAAREKAKQLDRLEVCDVHIGQVFAHSPKDETDTSIPLIPIRDVIEQCDSGQMQRGYAVGLYNLRGTFSKGMYEGGEQERNIAERFRRYADACARWPRTSGVLRGVASDYLRQAAEEDERAKARE